MWRLNTAKSTNYIGKWFKQNLSEIKFSRENSLDAYLYLPQEWSYGALNICYFLNDALEWENRLILGLKATKRIPIVLKNV